MLSPHQQCVEVTAALCPRQSSVLSGGFFHVSCSDGCVIVVSIAISVSTYDVEYLLMCFLRGLSSLVKCSNFFAHFFLLANCLFSS